MSPNPETLLPDPHFHVLLAAMFAGPLLATPEEEDEDEDADDDDDEDEEEDGDEEEDEDEE